MQHSGQGTGLGKFIKVGVRSRDRRVGELKKKTAVSSGLRFLPVMVVNKGEEYSLFGDGTF